MCNYYDTLLNGWYRAGGLMQNVLLKNGDRRSKAERARSSMYHCDLHRLAHTVSLPSNGSEKPFASFEAFLEPSSGRSSQPIEEYKNLPVMKGPKQSQIFTSRSQRRSRTRTNATRVSELIGILAVRRSTTSHD